jgi:hypothetical protein
LYSYQYQITGWRLLLSEGNPSGFSHEVEDGMVGERLMVGRGGKKEILVFKLIILSYFKGRRMDELFTFNSRQLQNITNRAPPLSTSPQYRKRILSNKFSTKLNKLS